MAVNNISYSNGECNKKCGTCGFMKPMSMFHKRGDGADGYRSDCKQCHHNKNAFRSLECHHRKNIEDPARYRNYRRKAYEKRRAEFITCIQNSLYAKKYQCGEKGITFSITAEYVKQIFDEQDGLCKLTGRELLWGLDGWNRDTLSIDRIDQNLGYIEGNIRLITYQANRARGELSDEQLLQFCLDVIKQLDGKVNPDGSKTENRHADTRQIRKNNLVVPIEL